MSFISFDVQKMILERVNGEQLRDVARVKKTWREYIDNNIHNMRSIPSTHMFIQFDSAPTGRIKRLITEGDIRRSDVPISTIFKFVPTRFILFSILRTKDDDDALIKKRMEKIKKEINSIPEWWIKQIGKIEWSIDDVIFWGITSRIPQMESFRYRPQDDNTIFDEYEETIMKHTMQVDLFSFEYGDVSFILDAIVEKSLMYPTEFPFFSQDILITIIQFERFIQRVNWTDIDVHKVTMSLLASQEEWNTWLEKNTTPVDIPQDIQPLCGYDWEDAIYRFSYQGKKILAEIDICTYISPTMISRRLRF